VVLSFPQDHGAHPDFRTEWWYLTARVRDATGAPLGVQVTFFRHRPGLQEGSLSRFAPTQLLFAHAAIADPRRGRLLHDQRAARAGFGLAEAAVGNTEVRIEDWSLVLENGRYRARLAGRTLGLELSFDADEAPLLQGRAGLSRKGPRERQASFYYSRPRLRVRGTLSLEGRRAPVEGLAWLDHEWSSEILDASAVGWDWTGLRLSDGGALTAFQVRDAGGSAIWAGGSLRDRRGGLRVLGPGEVSFTPLRQWRSPRTGIAWPVAVAVQTPAGVLSLTPLMDDQELDSRASVGTVYWEGAVDAQADGRTVGEGYLELTGYGGRMRL
jgi:predicted secreted hydrolase